ncbi:predicted protein [Chaetomium globosum CBS 148.51]|uniref:Uncharacterized protein n=1 Tax=Chaetomium globosum (strain ATCC 6205 / CBS 148.51 / DSM 1962 / NBRC 6347 / NRRL 1970) TaxID=306901 RepID=Q2GN56_CHAGB|nr:uncharacterized protein CHGG_10598 [Chaetomium globosum CBS 148.51]EAQ84194.1 predicted protein [Chaetomium globosum CBS 148.51]
MASELLEFSVPIDSSLTEGPGGALANERSRRSESSTLKNGSERIPGEIPKIQVSPRPPSPVPCPFWPVPLRALGINVAGLVFKIGNPPSSL